jgi:hypothetical protein
VDGQALPSSSGAWILSIAIVERDPCGFDALYRMREFLSRFFCPIHSSHHSFPSLSTTAEMSGFLVSWQMKTHHEGEFFCRDAGMRLCKLSEYCGVDRLPISLPVSAQDIWAPVADALNEWVQLGAGHSHVTEVASQSKNCIFSVLSNMYLFISTIGWAPSIVQPSL